jgi:catechol 2,3-dioxygenase-like lactoylglutathione lyase family enzyme
MKLNHITIIVSDFESSKAFYARLGLEQIVDAPPRYARFVVPGNEATFSIEVTDGRAPMDSYQSQVFFECDDLDGTVERLKAAGVVFAQDPTDMPYLWREARLRDPDGHDIRLYHAGENRLNPPWRLTAGAGV